MGHGPVWRLADQIVGGNLEQLIRSKRRRGLSYPQIRDELYDEHGLRVSSSSLTRWGKRLDVDAAA